MALICSMSMNAQIVKLMKGSEVVAIYSTAHVDNIVFEESTTIGSATRTGDIDVTWVQLWENGPKFAEYNVGAANNKPEDYGGYYCWGKSIDKDPNGGYKDGSDVLTVADEAATNLWGTNWSMPTVDEIQALYHKCDAVWTDNYKGTGITGRIFTGKGDYKYNSVFLPAAGYNNLGEDHQQENQGRYWSSTPFESKEAISLFFSWGAHIEMLRSLRKNSLSVRAVLAE